MVLSHLFQNILNRSRNDHLAYCEQ